MASFPFCEDLDGYLVGVIIQDQVDGPEELAEVGEHAMGTYKEVMSWFSSGNQCLTMLLMNLCIASKVYVPGLSRHGRQELGPGR